MRVPRPTFAGLADLRFHLRHRVAWAALLATLVLVAAAGPAAATNGEDPPGAPLALTASPGPDGVLLQWQPPLDEGTSPVTSYRVYRASEPDPAALIATTSVLSFVDESPSEAAYDGLSVRFYVVSAVNDEGEGPASQPASTATVAAGPCLHINAGTIPPGVAIDPDECLAFGRGNCQQFTVSEPWRCWFEILSPDQPEPGVAGLFP